MKYQEGVRLSIPEASEREALAAPLSLDQSSSLDNAALARSLAFEGAAIYKIHHTVMDLASSPIWRLMAAEIVAAAADGEELRFQFLLASARLFQAGSEAERVSE
jgi:hypothetical protein